MRSTYVHCSCVFVVCSVAIGAQAADSGAAAAKVLEATGVRGGVVVHAGCGDGKLTAALRASDSFLVHGVDVDGKNVEAARKHIQSLGLYGPVSVAKFDGKRLPYIDNFANLIVLAGDCQISRDELLRVLAPLGVAYDMRVSPPITSRKPWPAEIDQWTHYLHDPSNNAVAHDTAIDFLTRMQWIAGPAYSRHHDHMSGASAMVSAQGRVFYVFEESPRASILIPPKWHLYARDAFNGTLLWKRPIERWHEHLYPLKSGPALLPRRLVAVGDKVYVTLNIDSPVSELDAATGKTLRTYDATAVTEEILFSEGVLFLVVADAQSLRSDPKKVFASMAEIRSDATDGLWGEAPRTVMAVEAASGKVLWKKSSPLMPLTLAADGKCTYFHDGGRIVCLRRADGEQLWASSPVPNQRKLRSSAAPTLVVYDDVVLYSGYSDEDGGARAGVTTMFAISARDGRPLWKADHPAEGHSGSSKDILVLNGVVWCGATAQGTDSGISTGRDLHSGKVLKEFPPDVQTHWFHQRCYRAKATDKYLLYSRTGIEFVDVAASHWTCHHWVRGACLYGLMPANGMIYNPPHPCACYLDAKLFGFNALAPDSKYGKPRRDVPDAERLEKGPAYEEAMRGSPVTAANPEDWPMHRANPARGGSTKTTVAATNLRRVWQTQLGGKLSAPVIADGRLYVASVHTHDVHALDATTGKRLWSFTADGRVDSAPTIWRGRVLFGSADGFVYCLQAADGTLAWRFRAAPEERRHFAFEQLESVWPVSGSVLVQNDTLYCVAGRSMFVDGGLRLLRLNPATGQKLSETILDERDPQTQENLQVHIRGLNMPTALPDILSSDGRQIYMRTLPFDLQGVRKTIGYAELNQRREEDLHLFSPTGLLDDTLWHRTYWLFGNAFSSGAGGYYRAGRIVPAGRILAFDEEHIYGYGRLWQYYRWSTPLEFHLFATTRQPELVTMGAEAKPARAKDGKKKANLGSTPLTRFGHSWSDEFAIQATAMTLADKTLFVAGPRDVVDEEQAVKRLSAPETKQSLAEQEAALEGKRGSLLVAVSASEGKQLAAYRLEGAPVFDGLAAARGRLYVSTMDGSVLCCGQGDGSPLPTEGNAIAVSRGLDADRPTGAVPPATTSKAN